MKLLQFATLLLLSAAITSCTTSRIGKSSAPATVEASCGQCQFGMQEKGCDLAVRIDGEAYFVEGTGIDDHGDAHAHDGFCEAIRKAEVVGKVKDDKFIAKEFKLVSKEH